MHVSLPCLPTGCHIDNVQTNTFHLVKKIMKIGPVDSDILWLNLEKKKKLKQAK